VNELNFHGNLETAGTSLCNNINSSLYFNFKICCALRKERLLLYMSASRHYTRNKITPVILTGVILTYGSQFVLKSMQNVFIEANE
jgi:hypothetical protein